MKKIFVSTLILVFSSSVIQSQEKVIKDYNQKELQLIASKICAELQISKTSSDKDPSKRIENHFLKHLNITRETKDYKLIVSEFWNKYSEFMVCNNDLEKYRNPQSFLKRVVDMNMYRTVLYDFFLYDEEEYPISVNAIEVYNGKEETLLDYLDNILADPINEAKYDFNDIGQLRTIIIDDYGAKKASELKK